MGQGIAQLAASAGLQVRLHDARPGASAQARERIVAALEKQRDKGRVSDTRLEQARAALRPVETLQDLVGCQLVVEAIVEDLPAKQALFRQLEVLLEGEAILASNTSSLSITAIASACDNPGRVAGLHFFNPVPRMRLVEVIPGLATRGTVVERLLALVRQLGHEPVRARDSPGFLVNHAGRAYGTEALRILAEGVTGPAEVDALLRDGAGFPMGPFELMDLVGLDVGVPVMESIYRQFYEEPRYRTAAAPAPGRRLSGTQERARFPSLSGGCRAGSATVCHRPADAGVAGLDEGFDAAILRPWLSGLGAELEEGARPSAEALCLLAPLGLDATEAVLHFELDPTRVVAFDALAELASHRCDAHARHPGGLPWSRAGIVHGRWRQGHGDPRQRGLRGPAHPGRHRQPGLRHRPARHRRTHRYRPGRAPGPRLSTGPAGLGRSPGASAGAVDPPAPACPQR